MKVLVVGAAGKTGRTVVEQAKQAGHQVTAFVRTARAQAIARADLAAFLVAQLTSDEHLREAVTIGSR